MSPMPTPRSSAAFSRDERCRGAVPQRTLDDRGAPRLGCRRPAARGATSKLGSVATQPPGHHSQRRSAAPGRRGVLDRPARLESGSTGSRRARRPVGRDSPPQPRRRCGRLVPRTSRPCPTRPTRTVTTAAIPSAVISVRRGARRTLRAGMRAGCRPGAAGRARRRARPCPSPPGSRPGWPRSASSAHRARPVERSPKSGSRSPSSGTAERRPSARRVSRHRQRQQVSQHPAEQLRRPQADADPEHTPRARRSAAPSSNGRSASRAVGTPSAIPMPISRRCASTMRVARLKAANAAPARISSAKMLNTAGRPRCPRTGGGERDPAPAS